jgi:adenylylsulfate kinase
LWCAEISYYMVYWFTGQAGAGKTTLALALRKRLEAKGRIVVHVDGDVLRSLKENKDYTPIGRIRNIEDAMIISLLLNKEGIDVVVSMVSPYKNLREKLKSQLKSQIVEIYVHTTEVRGKEGYFVTEYQKPIMNYIDMDTTNVSVDSCLDRIPIVI